MTNLPNVRAWQLPTLEIESTNLSQLTIAYSIRSQTIDRSGDRRRHLQDPHPTQHRTDRNRFRISYDRG